MAPRRGVPPLHRWDAMVVTQDAHCCRIEKEVTSRREVEAQPPRRKHPKNMAMRKSVTYLPLPIGFWR